MTETALEFVLGPVEAVPLGEGRTFAVAGEQVAIFRSRNGQVFAIQAECPHRGGPLADGLLGGSTLICPLHAWKFDLTSGRALIGDCGLKTFPVHVNDSNQLVLTFAVALADSAVQ